jgi:hypothetical protein
MTFAPAGSKLVSRAPGFAASFDRDGVGLRFGAAAAPSTLRLRFPGATRTASPLAQHPTATTVTNLTASARPSTATAVGTLRYRSIFPGVDLRFEGRPGTLEYAFDVRPGADPSRIRLDYAGARSQAVAANGSLRIRAATQTLINSAPRAFQVIAGRQVDVPSRFVVGHEGVGFRVGAYDHARALTIDPTIGFSKTLGGSSTENATDTTVGPDGSVYVTGETFSSDFPTTAGAYDTSYNDDSGIDTFVTKLNPSGTVVWSTYLGGSERDAPAGIRVDGTGVYVAGETRSTDFPTTAGAYDTSLKGESDAFATKLSLDGTQLLWSTYLGGNGLDEGKGLDVDSAGAPYLTGVTNNGTSFPTSASAYSRTTHGSTDVFVTKLNPSGASLDYSTIFGGLGSDGTEQRLHGIDVNAEGDAYITAATTSTDLPTTAGAFDTSANGAYDGFLAEFNATGSDLLLSTYLGGSSTDEGRSVALGPDNSIYVVGVTDSDNFPTTPGAFDQTHQSGGIGDPDDGFATRFAPDGKSLIYSTFIGGHEIDTLIDVAVDPGGKAYVTGRSSSEDFPITSGSTLRGEEDAVIGQLAASNGAVLYSRFIGGRQNEVGNGVALDQNGNALVYVAGQTNSNDFSGSGQDLSIQPDAFVSAFSFAGTPSGCQDTDANGNLDNDGDGLCDSWETAGIDTTGDGYPDAKLWDTDGDGVVSSAEAADPNHKDLFLELDYMKGHKPNPNAVADVVAAFAKGDVTNPDGQPGIKLHVQVDEELPHSDEIQLDGGCASEKTPGPNVANYDDLKSLGSPAERAPKDLVTNGKRLFFRYGIFAHNQFEQGSTSGCSELPGNDFVISLGGWTKVEGHGVGTRDEQAGTLMHEFGHSLGLHHGGGDDNNCKPNYLSVMSYARQTPSAIPSRPLDYSRSELPTLDEAHLDETAGIGGAAGDQTAFGPPKVLTVAGGGAIDWDRDGALSTDTTANLDNFGKESGCTGKATTLTGFDDWSHIVYDFRGTPDYADGVHTTTGDSVEMTAEQEKIFAAIGPTTPGEGEGESPGPGPGGGGGSVLGPAGGGGSSIPGPGGSAKPTLDSAVEVKLASAAVKQTKQGRTLVLKLRAAEHVRVSGGLKHGKRTLAKLRPQSLEPGQHTVVVKLGRTAPAGQALLGLTARDDAGNVAMLKKRVTVPRS